MNNDSQKTNSEQFVALLVPNQRKVQAFILMLVPNKTDADDIFQETICEMWNKFGDFQPGTDFTAWAVTIAKYKVLAFHKRKKNSKLMFSSRVSDLLASVASTKVERLHEHVDVLRQCLGKLSKKEVFLLKMRYEDQLTFKEMSARTGKQPSGLHRMMATIHSRLALCVRRTLRLEEVS
ncbi:RNA polymerase sigma factor [Anaerohalosphaera lusitana]|uniref:RNA polymerase sigma factor n=1 Tax=Anaerohalosphaera lusitana TaxID=1936003 RepID=A0A1U9NMD7_9BACT|nr:sigma-70 family RNA polymerase sigma factor [Anaerohalosphaera lusitana]AQT69073.1 RNA polymerase sigma factor [Anaerohalosphaera lusitana]